ncbi:unnamed protein product, partial [marine sediment metagenome]
ILAGLYVFLVVVPGLLVGPAVPKVEVDSKVCDLGRVAADKTVTGSFQVTNTGRADLVIGRLRMDCLCGKVEMTAKRIGPGQSRRLRVEYHTPEADGPIASNVLVETNVPGERFLHLKVIGRMGPEGKTAAKLTARPEDPAGTDAGEGSLPAPGALRVILLYSPTCAGCDDVVAALAASRRRWGSRISIEKRTLDKVANFRGLLLYEEHYGSNETAAPKLFVGSSYLAGPGDIVARLDDVIGRELAAGSVTFIPPRPAEPTEPGGLPAEILAKFQGFSV